jgi:hypothetical protein
MAHKYFTLAQANRTLPLVQRIVADITARYPRWRDLVYRYELIAAQSHPDRGESREQVELRLQIEQVAHEINDFLVELDQVGCVFKGFEQGLVDFYGQLDGREVFWCWKLGEPAIEHWHELDTGFAGRQPVTTTI